MNGQVDEAVGHHYSESQGEENAHPSEGALGVAVAEDGTEHDQRQRRLDGELGEVEAELDRRLTAVDGQGEGVSDELSGNEPQRVGEEQPDHQGHLAHREGVGIPAELEMHHGQLGQIDQRDHHQPGETHRGVQGRQVTDGPGERRRRHDLSGYEKPYPPVPGVLCASPTRSHRIGRSS